MLIGNVQLIHYLIEKNKTVIKECFMTTILHEI